LPQFWYDPVIRKIWQHPAAVCSIVFPQYRPDLIQLLAAELGFNHKDFRYDVLRPLGWSAGQAPLTLLDQEIMRADDGLPGLVLANAEALLSAKTEEERRNWLASVLLLSPPRSVVLPLTLFGSLLPESAGEHVLFFSEEDLPAPETMQ
jgi:hypothetical protein